MVVTSIFSIEVSFLGFQGTCQFHGITFEMISTQLWRLFSITLQNLRYWNFSNLTHSIRRERKTILFLSFCPWKKRSQLESSSNFKQREKSNKLHHSVPFLTSNYIALEVKPKSQRILHKYNYNDTFNYILLQSYYLRVRNSIIFLQY